jgi:hypothetical protein
LQQDGDIVPLDFDTDHVIQSKSSRLVLRLIQHRRETEELAPRRFVDYNLLMIFIDCGDAYPPRNQDVRPPTRISDFVDALSRHEPLHLDLSGEHCGFFVIQQTKQWNVLQNVRAARHGNLAAISYACST